MLPPLNAGLLCVCSSLPRSQLSTDSTLSVPFGDGSLVSFAAANIGNNQRLPCVIRIG